MKLAHWSGSIGAAWDSRASLVEFGFAQFVRKKKSKLKESEVGKAEWFVLARRLGLRGEIMKLLFRNEQA